MPASAAAQVLPALNDAGEQDRRRRELAEDGNDWMSEREREAWARGDVEMVFWRWLAEMDRMSHGPERRDAGNATLGYVTHDVCALTSFVWPSI